MLKQAKVDPKRMKHVEAIVLSMTPEERQEPGDHQRLAPRAHRQGGGPADQRGQPAARAVPRHAEDDEENGAGRTPDASGHDRNEVGVRSQESGVREGKARRRFAASRAHLMRAAGAKRGGLCFLTPDS